MDGVGGNLPCHKVPSNDENYVHYITATQIAQSEKKILSEKKSIDGTYPPPSCIRKVILNAAVIKP